MQFQISRRDGRLAFMALGAGVCLSLAGFGAAFAAGGGQFASASTEGLRPALYQALVVGQPSAQMARRGCTDRAGSRLKACFGERSVHFTGPRDQRLSLNLAAYGRAGALVRLGVPAREYANGRLNYRYAGLTEWWRAVPQGFEQGFSIARKPAGSGPLLLTMKASRSARQRGKNLAWGGLRYGGLAVTDASGRHLPAAIAARDTRVTISVNDRNAVYPLTVDPMVWISQRIAAPLPVTVNVAHALAAPVPASSVTTTSAFGAAVVLHGGTAFVGAPFTTVAGAIQQGAVYVFKEAADRAWSQADMLAASNGVAYDQFGSQLALSGSTLLVGAPGAASARGAAYVFTPSSGTWTQAAKLMASDGAVGDEFGGAVGLSGTTALIGARYAKVGANASQGAAYLFTQSGGTWSEAGKLTSSDGAAGDLFGSAVAFDGTETLIGAPAASVNGNKFAGAAYAFAKTAGVWTEAQKLVASDGAVGDSFGKAVALDATTALVGAPEATVSGQVNEGKVYLFASAGGAWTQSAILTAGDGSAGNQFGAALALEAGRALIGSGSGIGHVYMFEPVGGSWAQSQEFFAGTGYGKALDVNGLALIVGAPGGLSGTGGGSVYFYEPANLAVAYSAPAEAKINTRYTGNVVVTNNAATASPPLVVVTLTPPGASLGTAVATQGDCTVQPAGASCPLGQVAGNGGQAKIGVTFNVTPKAPATLYSFTEVASAVPAVTASTAVRVPQKKSSGGGGGGELGLGLLAVLGLFALAGGLVRRRH